MPDPAAAPIPAATLVVLRDMPGEPPELLMVERAKAMRFAGGALVFPGGRVDPGDHALAAVQRPDLDPDDAAARIAAVRETVEESALPIGLSPMPDADAVAAMRAALIAGAPFGTVIADAGLTLDLDQLEPFARWLPDHPQIRTFDTRFYLARLPDGAPEPQVDATENTRLFWSSAQGVLDDASAGTVTVIYPTRRNLERLATFASFEEAVANARAHPVRIITPFAQDRADGRYLCIPEDLGYPITAERMADAQRS